MTTFLQHLALLLLVVASFLPYKYCSCQADTSTGSASASTGQWEIDVLEAWGREPDCARSTGMCDACGLGATVVEIGIDDDGNAKTTAHSAMVGPGGRAEPFNYDEATFEIASYTKHFTALGMVKLELEIEGFADTTIGRWFPCDWEKAWYPAVADITLQELRLHTSGLPPQAPNHDEAGGDGNPFAGYTEEMLCDSLLKLTGLPAKGRFVYSNYAYGMLGYALAIAATKPGDPLMSYEEVMKMTVLDPLGMNNTSVTLDEAGWSKAARGCDRGLNRGHYAMRRGEYGVLQGNGALRSTLPDMSKFLAASLLVGGELTHLLADPNSNTSTVHEAIKNLGDESTEQKDACTCVSGWCEGNLCPLPNPVKERITDSGATIYTSGGVVGRRKSGDTEGYSVRGAWSYQKKRAVFVVETCGGCGERGTSGSAAQRVALLLADGPPQSDQSSVCSVEEMDKRDSVYKFVGVADSHVYPSFVDLQVEVRSQSGPTAVIAAASSDGAGCAVTAKAVEGGWEFDTSVLYGCGFGGDDPLASLPQKRSLRLLPDGSGAILQEMGEDIYLTYAN